MPIDLSHLHDLRGRSAIVTGSSSGLGARFARVLHAAGATVVLAARRRERLDDLADDLGERVHVHPVDLRSERGREELIAETIDRFGKLDVLVNNAAIGKPVRTEEETPSQFADVLDVNVGALFHLCQLAAADMLPRGDGAIVNIASIFGLVAAYPIHNAAYCASKGAVLTLTRELGAHWAHAGVRVNAIAPGWFESEMTAAMWDDPKSLRYVERGAPAGRRGRPDELDAALLFLAGPGSSYVNGHVLAVDGGWTAH